MSKIIPNEIAEQIVSRDKDVILFAQNLVLHGMQLTQRMPGYGADGEQEMREAVRLSRALYSEIDSPTERPAQKPNTEPEELDGL